MLASDEKHWNQTFHEWFIQGISSQYSFRNGK
jgi:hypothetical protein